MMTKRSVLASDPLHDAYWIQKLYRPLPGRSDFTESSFPRAARVCFMLLIASRSLKRQSMPVFMPLMPPEHASIRRRHVAGEKSDAASPASSEGIESLLPPIGQVSKQQTNKLNRGHYKPFSFFTLAAVAIAAVSLLHTSTSHVIYFFNGILLGILRALQVAPTLRNRLSRMRRLLRFGWLATIVPRLLAVYSDVQEGDESFRTALELWLLTAHAVYESMNMLLLLFQVVSDLRRDPDDEDGAPAPRPEQVSRMRRRGRDWIQRAKPLVKQMFRETWFVYIVLTVVKCTVQRSWMRTVAAIIETHNTDATPLIRWLHAPRMTPFSGGVALVLYSVLKLIAFLQSH
jgi:hypothetical protein